MALIKQAELPHTHRESFVLDLADVERQARHVREAARRAAETMIAEARLERTRIVAGAAEAGRADGYARGLEEGREAGRAEARASAMDAARAEIGQATESMRQAAAEIAARREGMLASARTDVLRLALSMGERITKRAIDVQPERVADQVAAALAIVATPTSVVVEVAPDDLGLVREAVPRLAESLTTIEGVEVRGDEGMARGSCVVRTRGGGAIEARVDELVGLIVRTLLPGSDTAEPTAEDGPGVRGAGDRA